MRSLILCCLALTLACGRSERATPPSEPPPPPPDRDSGKVVDTSAVFDTSDLGRSYLDSLNQFPRHTLRAAPRPLLGAATSYSGRPWGAFNMVELNGSQYVYDFGPAPYTATITATYPAGICKMIAFHRATGRRVVPFMTGGAHSQYKTGGRFDPEKWKSKLRQYNTAEIRSCVAAAVSDGTVIGNALLDEPENKDWGGDGTITKPMLDYLALYAKQYFPSLPMGVNHGASGYLWRASERFTAVDYVNYQYRWDAARSNGNPAIYRDKVFAQSAYDGVATSFSLNVLAGGIPDRVGAWDCHGSGQYGTSNSVWPPLCRMTPDQLRQFGTTLGTAQLANNSVCALLMWKYDPDYFRAAGVVGALGDVADKTNGAPKGSCRRP